MSRREIPDPSRRRFVTTAASAVAATTILPRHVLGGPGFVAPSDKVNVAVIGVGGQGRTNCRALMQQDDCQIIAIADVAEEWDLSPYYYGGMGGRGPVGAEIETHYAEKTPNYTCAAYEDFRPRPAHRDGQADAHGLPAGCPAARDCHRHRAGV